MPHTNYKQMIEEFDKIEVNYTRQKNEYGSFGFTEPLMMDTEQEKAIKSFLKSSYIKSLNYEIEYWKDELEDPDKAVPHSQHKFAIIGRNQVRQDHISYLLAQRKLIEEEI